MAIRQMEKSETLKESKEHEIERRRTIRIKRSTLLNANLDDIDRPAIKIAETKDELKNAFQYLSFASRNRYIYCKVILICYIYAYYSLRFSAFRSTNGLTLP